MIAFKKLLRFFYREPDFIIIRKNNSPYMRRWYVIPRNRWFNIYLHNTLQDDDDFALHDHPWWNISVVLKGGYWEVTPRITPGSLQITSLYQDHRRVWRRPGSIIFRRATDAHRLELERDSYMGTWNPITDRYDWTKRPRPSWSLFITGPNHRTWGFWYKDGWRSFKDVTIKEDGVSRHKSDA